MELIEGGIPDVSFAELVDEEGEAFFGVEVSDIRGGYDDELVALAEGEVAFGGCSEKGIYFLVLGAVCSFAGEGYKLLEGGLQVFGGYGF